MLKNFISFREISHFICNFISLICSFQQSQCCECRNVSMGFWKSRVIQKSCQVTRLWLVTWDICITCDFPKPHSHISYSQYFHIVHTVVRLYNCKRSNLKTDIIQKLLKLYVFSFLDRAVFSLYFLILPRVTLLGCLIQNEAIDAMASIITPPYSHSRLCVN